MARRPDPENIWSGYGTAYAIMGSLLGGIVAWGAVGYVLDRIFEFRWLFLPIGMLIGVSAGIYLVIKRYGTDARE